MSEPGATAPQQDPAPQKDPASPQDSASPQDFAQPIDIGHVDPSDEQNQDDQPHHGTPVRRIVLSGLLAVALAGVAVAGYTAWKIAAEKDATITTPETIGTLRLDRSDDGVQTADFLKTALSAEVDLDEAAGAVYTDATGSVLFLGGTGLIWTPESDLDTAFGLIADNEGAVTGLHDESAGPLGGTMKCGVTKSEDGDLAVCGWADHGSLAMAMFTNRGSTDAAPLFREIRSATQKR